MSKGVTPITDVREIPNYLFDDGRSYLIYVFEGNASMMRDVAIKVNDILSEGNAFLPLLYEFESFKGTKVKVAIDTSPLLGREFSVILFYERPTRSETMARLSTLRGRS